MHVLQFTCCRRAANELAAQDAVAGLMALSNGQIQGTGVDKDSNSDDVVCRVKRTDYNPRSKANTTTPLIPDPS
jgi:hypothetical protein